MKNLRKNISEEIQKLVEDKYPMPLEIQNALEVKLKMTPIIRYVDYLKAVNSIPPSNEVNLHNGKRFLIFYEDFSLMVKIGSKKYYLGDAKEKNAAIDNINKLLTDPKISKGGEMDDSEDTETLSEPADEPAEEPAEEEPEA